jgi:hypothetical protein
MSAATPLTTGDTYYMQQTFTQLVYTLGIPLTYSIFAPTSFDSYGNPIPAYTQTTIVGVITDLSPKEYDLIEPGFEPTHYANFYTADLTPQVGDQVLWKGFNWEVRNSMPIVLGTQTIYHYALLRRVLQGGTLGAGQ